MRELCINAFAVVFVNMLQSDQVLIHNQLGEYMLIHNVMLHIFNYVICK